MASGGVSFYTTNMHTMSCGDPDCEFKSRGTYKANLRIVKLHMKIKHPEITKLVYVNTPPVEVRVNKSQADKIRANLGKHNEEMFKTNRAKVLSMTALLEPIHK
jgi:hypothetical protein